MIETKDRADTEAKLLKAVGRVLAQQGFERIGVNAIAKEAGVDKVLLYRYFGGLEGLLHAYAQSSDFWPMEAGGDEAADVREEAKRLLLGHLRALRARPLTQEIMRWELQTRNALTDDLARHREEIGRQMLASVHRKVAAPVAELDVEAIGALLHAGLSYLVLRGKTADVYMNVELGSAKGDRRLERAVSQILMRLLPDPKMSPDGDNRSSRTGRARKGGRA